MARAWLCSQYWQPLHLDSWPRQLRLPLFSCSVLHGIRETGEMLQISLNGLALPLGTLVIDGHIGPKTLEKIASVFVEVQATGRIKGFLKHFKYLRLNLY